MAKRKTRKISRQKKEIIKVKSNSQGVAIFSIIVNLLIPGIGSIFGGKIKEGTWQILMTVLGLVIFMSLIESPLALIGIPIYLTAWIWGIVTGATLLQEAR